jgi:hypothetical protein
MDAARLILAQDSGDSVTKRKTRITFESERLLVIRRPTSRAHRWCAACADDVQVVTAEDAAIVADRSMAAICCAIDEARLHAVENGDGLLLVCLNSLLKLK